MTDKSTLKTQVTKRFNSIINKVNFNDLLELDDYFSDWQNNLNISTKMFRS